MRAVIGALLIIALTIRIAYKNVKRDYRYCDDEQLTNMNFKKMILAIGDIGQ